MLGFKVKIKSNNSALNVLLFHNNASDNYHEPGLVHPIIQTKCLFKSTTSLLQTLNQGIITIFHTRHTFCNILDASE
jgi:hypothetical protein